MFLDGKNFLVQYEDGPITVCVFPGLVSSAIPHEDHEACYTQLGDGSWLNRDGEVLDQEDATALSKMTENVREHSIETPPPPALVASEPPTEEEIEASKNAPFAEQA